MDPPIQEIEHLKDPREVQALAIKTYNQVGTLAGSIRGITAQLDRQERRLRLQSPLSYGFVILLCAAVFWAAFRARSERLELAQAAAIRNEQGAREALSTCRKSETERHAADEHAVALYSLLRQGKRDEFLTRYPDLVKEPLSRTEAALFADAVEKTRVEQVFCCL